MGLLAFSRGDASDIRNTYALCKSLVHAQMGPLTGLRRTIQS
jgi:hypothetical protein